jgi:hypothetical protein
MLVVCPWSPCDVFAYGRQVRVVSLVRARVTMALLCGSSLVQRAMIRGEGDSKRYMCLPIQPPRRGWGSGCGCVAGLWHLGGNALEISRTISTGLLFFLL